MARFTSADALAAMRRAPLFSALNDAELRQLLDACRTTALPAGTLVFLAGRPADSFYVILAGRVKLYKLSARGDEQILHLYGPGCTFGEAAMWAGIAYPAHAEVVADAALLVVRRAALKAAIQRRADLALDMLAGMSAKLHEFSQLIEQLSLKEVPQRLAAVLLAQAAEARANAFRLKQTKRELAAQIGTVAATLSRAFAKLRASGLVEVRGRQITILDREALARLAES